MGKVLRVGFIGGGHISVFHAAALARIEGARLVGVFDVDPRRCEATAQAYHTTAFASMEALLNEGLDVVHVLTPPEYHARAAIAAIESGAHVLVEKPLATDVEDCHRIADAAASKGAQVCVDHSLLYDDQIRRALKDLRLGAIGRVVSVDMFRSAEYPVYDGGPLPPQYRTGGFPFRDLGIHQLYLMEAFLGPIEGVEGKWSSVGGEANLFYDEWSAYVKCRDGTGHARISFNVKPIQHQITVYGTDGVLRIDPLTMFSSQRRSTALPKAAERLLNAYGESLQCASGVSANAWRFLRGKIRQYHGVQELIEAFYRSLQQELPAPVNAAMATSAVYWVEHVARAADADAQRSSRFAGENRAPVVVTGAAGALGSAVVERLRAKNIAVRVFVRRNVAHNFDNCEVAVGDLADSEAVDNALRGARVVIHAGAAMKGGWATHRAATVVGTENVVNACLKHGVHQLIYISSLSVVRWADKEAGPISESSPLEPRPSARGSYTQAKLEAENLVREAAQSKGLRSVVIRPGQIFGGRLPLLNAAVARKIAGRYVILGNGKLRLPLVHMDDVVDGIVLSMERGIQNGEIVQLVGDALPTQNDIVNMELNGSSKIVRVPRFIVFALGLASEWVFGMLKRDSPFSRYRLRSALTPRTFVSEKAASVLGWQPHVALRSTEEPAPETPADSVGHAIAT